MASMNAPSCLTFSFSGTGVTTGIPSNSYSHLLLLFWNNSSSSSSSSSSLTFPPASLLRPHYHHHRRRRHLTCRREKIPILSSLQPLTVSTPSSSSLLDEFSSWAKEKGAAFPLVKPEHTQEGIGLVAINDIRRQETVVQVPKKMWIDSDVVAASDIGRACSVSDLKPWVRIALFVLREMSLGQASSWNPYLKILPRSMNSPIFWSEEELAELRGTQLLTSTLGIKEYVQSEFLRAQEQVIFPHKHLFPFQVTPEDFLWAFGVLRSRSFSSQDKNLLLVPLADLSD